MLNTLNFYFLIFLAGIIVNCNSSFSQNSTADRKRHFTFHIEKLDTSIAFDVCAANPVISVNENSSYSWYANGKIMETKGGFSGKLLDGRYMSFFENNNLKERGIYIKGRKEGKWMKWHPNGRINEISYWRMGVKQGKYVLYNDLGQRMLNAHFKHDKLNGTLISYEKDKVLTRTKYKNGMETSPKVKNEKSKPAVVRKDQKPSLFKAPLNKIKELFRKKDKPGENGPVKEKKRKDVSMSFN
jgi:hypothetical protein